MALSLFKGMIIISMVLTGALNTIGNQLVIKDFKFQNSQFIFEGPIYKLFFHPYIQTLFMFFA